MSDIFCGRITKNCEFSLPWNSALNWRNNITCQGLLFRILFLYDKHKTICKNDSLIDIYTALGFNKLIYGFLHFGSKPFNNVVFINNNRVHKYIGSHKLITYFFFKSTVIYNLFFFFTKKHIVLKSQFNFKKLIFYESVNFIFGYVILLVSFFSLELVTSVIIIRNNDYCLYCIR